MSAARGKTAKSPVSGGPRKSEEDVVSPRENRDPALRRNTPTPSDTENPPNENLNKDPDEAYGDTEIPGRNLRQGR
jgi:hypothetical protein